MGFRAARILVAFVAALFGGATVSASVPHDHTDHAHCAICAAPSGDRRRAFAHFVTHAQAGDGRPRTEHVLKAIAPVAIIHAAPIAPLVASSSDSKVFPRANSVLARAIVELPPARAPPVL